jgi:hypothetical protein
MPNYTNKQQADLAASQGALGAVQGGLLSQAQGTPGWAHFADEDLIVADHYSPFAGAELTPAPEVPAPAGDSDAPADA